MPELDLWLDPQGARPRAFVSHAHADHYARHDWLLCSEPTATLLRHRYSIATGRLEPYSFHTPFAIGDFRLRLLPAGHITGSAMLHITRTTDNATLLYTGDFKTRRSRTADTASFLTADTLIMETTFGLPHYQFPNRMEVEAELLGFVHDCFNDDITPVLLGYSLGKAQEALAVLHEHDIPVLMHPAAAAMTRACRDAGVTSLPEPVEFTGDAPHGHVIICPPHALKSQLFKNLTSRRTAMLSGWALQQNARYRYGVDAMIPFSDHADHPGLMECIQRVRPRRVFTVHGFSKAFAAELRTQNIDAWCAAGGDQLELPIHRPPTRQTSPSRGARHNRVLCQLADFSDLCRLLEKTGSRVSKLEFIANYLSSLEDNEDLRHAVNWLSGPQGKSRNSPLNPKALRHCLLSISGTSEHRYFEVLQSHQDELLTAVQILHELPLKPHAIKLQESADFVANFLKQAGSLESLKILSDRLTTLHPHESETLLKIITGNLRIGIDRPLMANALAQAFNIPLDAICQAPGKTPGDIAVQAKHGTITEAQ